MATLQLAYNATNITQIGNIISGTVFNTGFRVSPAGSYNWFDFFFTGADTVALNGGLYAATGDVIATLMDTSGNVLNTATPTYTTHVFTTQSVTYFSGLTPATTYWLRMRYSGPGSMIIQSDTLVQLSGASTTPTISVVTGYNPSQIYGFQSTYDGVINLNTKVGLEGEGRYDFIVSENLWASGILAATANGFSGGKIRFKASCTQIWARFYNPAAFYIRTNTLQISGTSGIPVSAQTFTNTFTGLTAFGPWQLIASGLSSGSALYELQTQASASGGLLLANIMTSGGTGIDTTTTAASLTRPLFASFIGDSIIAQDYPAGAFIWTLSNELESQYQNKAVLNAGIDGESLLSMVSQPARISQITTGPVPYAGIIIREGINDIKSGSPPTVAQLSAAMVSFINQVRAKGGGWATVKIWVEGMIPTNAMPSYSSINAYNQGPGGFSTIVAQFNAGTASGQTPATPDLNVHYVNIDPWNLAGPTYVSSNVFSGTNYVDGLHLNPLGGAIVKAQQLAYLIPKEGMQGISMMTGVNTITF